MKKPAKVRKKRRLRRPRNNEHGPGNHYSRMHRSEGRRRACFALYDDPQQEKPADAESAGKEKIQSFHEAAHTPPGDQIKCNQRPPNAAPPFAAPTARCRAVASISRRKRSITRTRIC